MKRFKESGVCLTVLRSCIRITLITVAVDHASDLEAGFACREAVAEELLCPSYLVPVHLAAGACRVEEPRRDLVAVYLYLDLVPSLMALVLLLHEQDQPVPQLQLRV